MAPGDFNEDGRVDLLSALGGPPARFYILNEGGPPNPLPFPLFEALPDVSLAVADVDGDHHLDALGCQRTVDPLLPEQIPLLAKGAGNGSFSEQQTFTPLPQSGAVDCRAIAPADYDLDGDVDLAFCGTTLALYENDGTGRFTERALGPTPQIAQLEALCKYLTWADVDADGDLDLSYTPQALYISGINTQSRGGTTIFLNDGGSFSIAPNMDLDLDASIIECNINIVPSAALRGGDLGMAWLDHDMDGDLDLFLPFPLTFCVHPPLLYNSRFAQGAPRLHPGAALSSGHLRHRDLPGARRSGQRRGPGRDRARVGRLAKRPVQEQRRGEQDARPMARRSGDG